MDRVPAQRVGCRYRQERTFSRQSRRGQERTKIWTHYTGFAWFRFCLTQRHGSCYARFHLAGPGVTTTVATSTFDAAAELHLVLQSRGIARCGCGRSRSEFVRGKYSGVDSEHQGMRNHSTLCPISGLLYSFLVGCLFRTHSHDCISGFPQFSSLALSCGRVSDKGHRCIA